MTTKLDRILKRELTINGESYTLTLSEDGFALTLKGRRKGLEIRWADLVGGDAALATALNASLTANIGPRRMPAARRKDAPAAARSQVEPAPNAIVTPRAGSRTKIESVAKPKHARGARPKNKPRPTSKRQLAARRRPSSSRRR